MRNINKLKKITFGALFTLIAVVLSCFVSNFILQNKGDNSSALAISASLAGNHEDSKQNAENPSANLLDSDIGNHSATYTASTEILNIVSGEITGVKSGYESQLTGELIIPEGMGITKIADSAFAGCTGLTMIGIPSTVYYIGANAFSGCSSLEKVAFSGSAVLASAPGTVYKQGIGANAFYDCSRLNGVYIPDLVSWCAVPFANEYSNPLSNAGILYLNGTEVTDLTIPSSVTSIGDYAFTGLSVDSVTISYSATASSIGDYAFYTCGMTSISISQSHVSSIGEYAFSGCAQLTSITLPSGVTTISEGAFSNCEELSSITFGSDTRTIETYAFDSCTSLTSITLPSRLTTIGSFAFSYCEYLTSITIPASVTKIDSNPFNACHSLTSIAVNSSNTAYYSEGNCLIEKSSKTIISGCKSSSIPTDVTAIGDHAFRALKSLTSISIPNSVSSIGKYAFYDCTNLAGITLSNALTSIGSWAFASCSKVLEYDFSSYKTIPSLGSSAFLSINSSCKIRVPASLYTNWIAATNWSTYANYIVAASEVAGLYKTDGTFVPWETLLADGYITVDGTTITGYDSTKLTYGKLVIDGSITIIGSDAFAECVLSTIILPNTVTTIETAAFSQVDITSINIPASVTSLGDYPFSFCPLTSITVDSANTVYYGEGNCIIERDTKTVVVGCKTSAIPSDVLRIGNYAFDGCRDIATMTIPNGVISIGSYAFDYCYDLTTMEIPASVTSMGRGVFSGCFRIENLSVASGNTVYYSENNCIIERETKTLVNGCKTSVIPADILHIGDYAFSGMLCDSRLTFNTIADISLVIPASVVSIGSCAFQSCDDLIGVTFLGDITSIGAIAFNGCSNVLEYNFTNCTSVPSIGGIDGFKGINTDCQIKVPKSLYEGWKAANRWSEYANNIVAVDVWATEAGLYNPDTGELIYSWAELIANNLVRVKGSRLVEVKKTLTGRMIVSSDITIIGTGAFVDSLLTELELSDSVEIIEDYAIVYPNSVIEPQLTTLKIGGGITYVGNIVFPVLASNRTDFTLGFKLTNLHIADLKAWCHADKGSLYIPVTNLFIAGKQVTDLVIPEGTEHITGYSFRGMEAITSVSIPSSVKSIGGNGYFVADAFDETIYNTEFTVAASNENYSSDNGVLFNKDKTILYAYPLAKGGAFTVPSSTTIIDSYAFKYARNITALTFGSNLTAIKNNAFVYLNFDGGDPVDITLPESADTLGPGVFSNANLGNIYLSSNIKSLSAACFLGATATSINVENIESLAKYSLRFKVFDNVLVFKALTSIEEDSLSLANDIDFSKCSAIPTIHPEAIGIPTDCTNKIYVPADLYDEWIVAENWSNYADYIVPVEEEDPTDSLAGGLYYVETNELIYSWENLLAEGLVEVSGTTLTGVQGGDGEGEYLLVIPEGITEIAQGVGAQNFLLGGLRLPSTLETVGMAAFAFTAIREINIPAACVSIGNYAFAASLACTAINVAATNPAYASVNGALFNKDKTILMVFPAGKSGSYTIPDTCQTIFDGAFSMSSRLTSVTIPNSVTTIGMGAFAQSGISGKLVLPNSLATITQNAFFGCANIEEIVLGSSVASIGEESFSGCESLTTISWTTSLTSLGTNAFSGCYSLTGTIDIPNVTSIPTKAFYDLPLVTAVNFSDRLTDIGESAFENCSSLTGSLVIPDSCTSISQAAFRNTGFTSVTISSGMQSISNYTFQNCTSLTTINWNSNLTDIGVAAFAGCSALAGTITIPSGVTILNSYAFQDCSSITGLNLHDSITQIGDLAFYNCTEIAGSLTLPSSLATIGQSAFRNCGKITGTLTVPSKVTSIGIYAFRDCVGLTTANIGNAVITIAEQSFYNCSGLTKVTIGNAVQTIGNNAFENCSVLASLTMGTSVQTIGERAFYGCSNLAGSLSLPSTLVDVGQSAFRDCKKLTGTLTFGNNVTTIGAYAFQNCSGFTGLVIGTNVETVGDLAFYNCTGLTSFSFNSTKITSIGTSAFRGLTKITGTITFPDTLTTIGDFAFHSATGITKFTFGANISSLGAGAFANCTGVTIYDFSKAANVPTLSNTNCFNGITSGVKIGVPGSLYSSWIAAENWSNYVDYIVVMGSQTVNYSLMYDPSHGTDVYIVKNGTEYRGTGSFTVNSGDVITVYMTDVYAVSSTTIYGFEVSQGSYSTFQTNSSGYKRDIDSTLDTNLILYNASSTLTIKTYVSNGGTKTYGTIVPMYKINYTLYYPDGCPYAANNTTADYIKTEFKLYFGEKVLASVHSTNSTATGKIAINSDHGLSLQIKNGFTDDYTMRFLCVGFEISISGASATYVNLTNLGNWTDDGYNFTTDKGQISGLNSSCTITIKTCVSYNDDMSGATVYSGSQITDDNDLPSTILPTNIAIEERQIIETLENAEMFVGEEQTTASTNVWLDDKFRKVQEQQTTNVDFDGITLGA